MGLLISINGADFQPYSHPYVSNPLVNRKTPTEKVQAIQRDLDHPEADAQDKHDRPERELFAYSDEKNKQNFKKAIYARDLMSSPVLTIPEGEANEKAIEIMAENKICYLVVLDAGGNIKGVLSDRDIALNKPMNTKVIAARDTSKLQEIARAMVVNQIGSVPILDSENQLVGIITASDILKSVMLSPSVELFA